MNPRAVNLSWAQIEAVARVGISYRAWGGLNGEGKTKGPPWFETLADAYDKALVHLRKCADSGEAPFALDNCDLRNEDSCPSHSTNAAGVGQYREAIALYRAMLASLPDGAADSNKARMAASAEADINLWLGNAFRIIGLTDKAIDAFRAAAAARPDFGDAYWSLANLKTYRFKDDEISAMEAALAANDTASRDRTQLCFALGKASEDLADYTAAWDYYERGNALQRETSRYRPEIFEINTAEQRRVCTRSFFEARRGWGHAAHDPIFVLGMPRAGSTLIEQILASHSQVDGTRELLMIQRLAFELQGKDPDYDNPRYPAVLETLSAEDCRRLGEWFLGVTRIHRHGRPYFIDKMPNNFRDIGLIALILPNARIIDARREPMACCLSNLKQHFGMGQEFSYSIDDIARYYRTYLELMRHWNEVLPGKVLRVCHEDLIDDLESEVRRILKHCDLPFEASCLAFHKNKRNVHTPSSEQVRRPLNRDGVDQWRNFETALDPLKAALGEALDNWRS